jgi:O-antigen ligase
LILVTGLIMSTSLLLKPRSGWPRYLWLIPCALLLTTLAMTHSRGALISFAFAFPAALAYFRGWRIGALSLLGLPVLAIVFSGRMTDLNSLIEGTGQSRIRLWSESLTIFKQYPFFGLGEGMMVEETGMVTHNSFLQCYAELGVFGGTAFLGCFLAALLGLWSLRNLRPRQTDSDGSMKSVRQLEAASDLAYMRVFVFTALAAYSAGLLTLSRQFVVPTFLILGLATSAESLHRPHPMQWRIGNQFVVIAALCGVGSLVAFQIAVRLFIRW